MEADSLRDEQYWSKIEKLNRAFLTWIQRYMEISPDYDFSPVCADYINHVNNLQRSFPVLDSKVNVNENSTPSTISSAASSINFAHSSTSVSHPSTPHPKMITKTIITTVSETFKPISGEVKVDASNGIPISDSTVTKSEPVEKSTNDMEGEQDEEDTPPPPPAPRVFEDDAIYSVRCKLYALVGDKYKERGLGQLYIKKAEGKSQLVIRTDNAVGTILLNIRLIKSLPISTTSKGVLLGCTPNPPMADLKIDGPVTLLIRVKTDELATQLKDKLLEYTD